MECSTAQLSDTVVNKLQSCPVTEKFGTDADYHLVRVHYQAGSSRNTHATRRHRRLSSITSASSFDLLRDIPCASKGSATATTTSSLPTRYIWILLGRPEPASLTALHVPMLLLISGRFPLPFHIVRVYLRLLKIEKNQGRPNAG